MYAVQYATPLTLTVSDIVLQIILEALVGLIFGIFGASLYVDQVTPLKEITWASEMKKR